MSTNVEKDSGNFDLIKWLLVAVLVLAGVVGNSVFSDHSLLYRVLALVALGVMASFVALQTKKGRDFSLLMKEARTEIRKVVWPTRPELTQTTLIVIAFVLFVAFVLWGIDSIIGWLVSSVIG